jgi:hypothetical protein
MAKKAVQVVFHRAKTRGSTLRCDVAIWTSSGEDATQVAHMSFKDFPADQEKLSIKLEAGDYVATARVWVSRAVNGKCGHDVLINGASMGQPSTNDIGTKDGAIFDYQMPFQAF